MEKSLVQTFANEEFDNVRFVIIAGIIWFVAADVCRILDLKNHRDAVSRLDDDEKDYVEITDAIGRNRKTLVVNESGLYALIFMSRKPRAKKFRKWVTSEVLPQIRKYGYYTLKKETPVKQISAKSRRAIQKINEEYPDDDIEFLGITSESNGSGNQYCFGLSKDFALKLLDELAEEK